MSQVASRHPPFYAVECGPWSAGRRRFLRCCLAALRGSRAPRWSLGSRSHMLGRRVGLGIVLRCVEGGLARAPGGDDKLAHAQW